MKNIIAVLAIFLLNSCVELFEEDEVYGYYVPVSYKNTFDTIQLKPNSIYHRKLYDKSNKMVLETTGSWKFEKGHRIILRGFYLNLDQDLDKFPYLASDTSMEVDSYFETKGGVIRFCVGYTMDENCYTLIAKY